MTTESNEGEMVTRIVTAVLVAITIGTGQPSADAAELFYGFDDGTFEGWQYIKTDGTEFPLGLAVNGWVPSTETIDIGDGFTLVPATSGDFRVVPFPWDTRDCLRDDQQCETQILRSPEFFLDDSGDISIDMIGGQLRGGTTAAIEEDFPLEVSDLPEFRTADAGVHASQGFALRDAASDEYLLFGFSDVENDGKMRASDPPSRGEWQTVSISQEDLAPYANNGQVYTVDIYDSFLGGWGWIGYDTVRIPGALATDGFPGDFDNNGVANTDDLDALVGAIAAGNNPTEFDLTGDDLVNSADLDQWLEAAAQENGFAAAYQPGDANLDGTVDAVDLNAMALNWQSSVSTWVQGDFTADGLVDASDLNRLALNWQQSIPTAAAVPEPSAWVLLMSGFFLLVFRRL